mmetsp:Transcript_28479/g.36963  ORF Transcript_28479/g.36963 Transcript_28479/m.36963 type:complete len:95 (-) Transcript_28479:38-322(-)
MTWLDLVKEDSPHHFPRQSEAAPAPPFRMFGLVGGPLLPGLIQASHCRQSVLLSSLLILCIYNMYFSLCIKSPHCISLHEQELILQNDFENCNM